MTDAGKPPFPTVGHWTESGSGLGEGFAGWIEFLKIYDYASPQAIKWLLEMDKTNDRP